MDVMPCHEPWEVTWPQLFQASMRVKLPTGSPHHCCSECDMRMLESKPNSLERGVLCVISVLIKLLVASKAGAALPVVKRA